MPRADAILSGFLEPQVRAALDRLPAERSLVEDLARVIVRRLPDGPPALEEVARAVGLAPRTLQRRLEAEGRSFVSVVDDIRRAEAERWLSAGVSIAETSFLVGYSEPRAFHRAFKRWNHRTPEAWRGELRGEQARRAPT